MALGGLGFYLLVKHFTENHFVSLLFGLEYGILFLARFYIYNTNSYALYCLLPLTLYSFIIYYEKKSRTAMLAFLFLFSQSLVTSFAHAVYAVSLNVSLFILFVLIFRYHRSVWVSIRTASLFTLLGLMASAFYLLPMFSNMLYNHETAGLAEKLGIIPTPTFSVDFVREFIYFYLPSYFYPIWSQYIIPHLPLWATLPILVVLLIKNDNKSADGFRETFLFSSWIILSLILFSVAFHDFLPRFTEDLARIRLGNIIRQLQGIHIFLLLAGAAAIDRIIRSYSFVKGSLALGLVFLLLGGLVRRQYGDFQILAYLEYLDYLIFGVVFASFITFKIWRGFPLPFLLAAGIILGGSFFWRAAVVEEQKNFGFPIGYGSNFQRKDWGFNISYSPDRYETFRLQTRFIDDLIGGDYLNFRTVFVTRYRDVNTILFKELSTLSRRKEPFGYFEAGNRYVNLMNMVAKGGTYRRTNLHNIEPGGLPLVINVFKLLGVKYIFS